MFGPKTHKKTYVHALLKKKILLYAHLRTIISSSSTYPRGEAKKPNRSSQEPATSLPLLSPLTNNSSQRGSRKLPVLLLPAMSGSGGNTRKKTCCGSCCTLLISLGFVVLIYWAIFQPHQIRATVEYAELSNLAVSNASSPAAVITYHVAVNLSLYNPSKRVNIYYDAIGAELLYRGAVLGPAAAAASPAEFYQRRRTAQPVRLEFDGKGVAVPEGVSAELEGEVKAAASLGLELSVGVRVRYVFGSFKIRQKPRVWCAVSIPVPRAPGGLGVLGSGDRCWVKY
ncbi:hypothetical protein GQ55_3G035100 [Panicum hallii var. hallii]|uniref:Late embryogenesis abundant protein LEA-2 subgroup domain-containing protein n=2 Tax=Panicum hallii TaxID=206008 RepID=A0A2T7E5B8_9POAL|nr:hypothetical protein GQ55_3G035100 [Panicum hallii var. hallii]